MAILLASILALSGVRAGAQTLRYSIECGKSRSEAVFESVREGEHIILETTIGSQKGSQTLDLDYQTLYWHMADPERDLDITVTRSDGVFRIKGRFEGEALDRVLADSGKPWYQHIGFSAGHALKEGTTTFVCVRPTDLEMFEMLATPKGTVEFGGGKPVRVKVSPSGALSRLWSCDYYYDPESLDFFGYKAVEGGPGTPVTLWKPLR